MSRFIEPKPLPQLVEASVSSGDQASTLRALFGHCEGPLRVAGSAQPARSPVQLRVVWLVDGARSHARGQVAQLASSVAQAEGVSIALESSTGCQHHGADGLLMICDSCDSVARALQRLRQDIAARGVSAPDGARTEAVPGRVGILVLVDDTSNEPTMWACARGMVQAADGLMDEPVELLGVDAMQRRRARWLSGRRSERSLSDESLSRIHNFLIRRVRSTCAIR
jgi:hypothetical protein